MDLELLRRAFADALAFVLPVDCAGCGALDTALCGACRAALDPTPRTRSLHGVTVATGLEFGGPVARVIRTLKSDGRLALARPLAGALVAASAPFALDGVDVVPVPTSRAAMRRRGFRVVDELARRAGWRPRRLVRLVRATDDQRALGRIERAANVAGSMRARDARGRRILVVDDVVTTGATLGEAIRALRDDGADVIGAVAVAAVPKLRGRLSDTFRFPTGHADIARDRSTGRDYGGSTQETDGPPLDG